MNRMAGISLAVLGALAATGCGANSRNRAYEYMPDMARGPAYKAFAPNPVTRDGLTLQRPVAGTIPRGYQPHRYGTTEAEAERAGRELHNPYRATPAVLNSAVLKEGHALYQIYCEVCHGERGDGNGPIASKIANPPSYQSDRVMQFPPGRIFHVITTGSGKMRAYAPQLAADERWKVVAYVSGVLQHREGETQ